MRGRFYLKLNLEEKHNEVFSAVSHVTNGSYHVVKIIRHFALLELFVDGERVPLEGEQSEFLC